MYFVCYVLILCSLFTSCYFLVIICLDYVWFRRCCFFGYDVFQMMYLFQLMLVFYVMLFLQVMFFVYSVIFVGYAIVSMLCSFLIMRFLEYAMFLFMRLLGYVIFSYRFLVYVISHIMLCLKLCYFHVMLFVFASGIFNVMFIVQVM